MRIALGICGSIAAYRSPDLVKALKSEGHDVHVMLTPSAKQFVSARVLEVVSENAVFSGAVGTLAAQAELFVVYAASADFLARYRGGAAEDPLVEELLYFRGPVCVAPAMNPDMWAHAAVREHVARLRERGVRFAGPVAGRVACGEEGLGHVVGTEALVDLVNLTHWRAPESLRGQRVLLSVGPMRSAIDPVRYVQNRSSGLMGLSLATAAQVAGADVTVLLGPVDSAIAKRFEGFRVHRYVGARDYEAALAKLFPECDVFFSAAAVLDFELNSAGAKLEREALRAGELKLPVHKTEDFVAGVAKNKRPQQRIVAFAAETGTEAQVLQRAAEKLRKKSADAILVNPVTETSGPEAAQNRMWLLGPGEKKRDLGFASKRELGSQILSALAETL